MKKWITFMVLLGIGGLATPIMAQPKWVNQSFGIRSFDSIHKDADAVILYNVALFEIGDNKTAKIKLRTAYKILTEAGVQHGTLILPSSKTIEVDDVRGWHKKPNQKLIELDDDMVGEVGFQNSAAYFDEQQQYIAFFPNVEPGDYVAFEAIIDEKGWTSCYQEFIFYQQQPVLLTKCTFTIPEDWKISIAEWNMKDIEKQSHENQYTWTYENLSYNKDELYRPSWHHLEKRISIVAYNPEEQSPTQFNSWENVANWCANVYKKPADVSPEIKKTVDALLKNTINNNEKLHSIANFVQENIRSVAIEIGKGGWYPRHASETYYNRYGDCKDKSTLMRAMLKSAGIKSVPVLINTINQVDRRLPTPFQFNHVIVGICINDLNLSPSFDNAIVDRWLFFDPTDPEVQIGELPDILQGSFAVLGTHEDSISYILPHSEPESYRRTYKLNGNILSDGSYSANVLVTSYQGWASEDRFYFRNNTAEEQKKDLYKRLSQNLPSVKIEDYAFTDYQDSLQIKFKILGKNILFHTEQNMILHPDIFSQSLHRPFVEEKRKYPIWFGSAKKIEKLISWKYPPSWKIELGTSEIKNKCNGASIDLKCYCENSHLNMNITYEQTGQLMDVQLYPQAKAFSKALQQAQGKMILFSK